MSKRENATSLAETVSSLSAAKRTRFSIDDLLLKTTLKHQPAITSIDSDETTSPLPPQPPPTESSKREICVEVGCSSSVDDDADWDTPVSDAIPIPEHFRWTPSKNTASIEALECRLEGKELWSKFYDLSTEMIITKSGRRMFPTVKIGVSGCDPDSLYYVFLDVVPVDNRRYRYIYNKSAWLAAGKAEPTPNNSLYLHPDSPFTGSQMAKQVVSFEKAKLTNNDVNKSGHLVLNSMHKYQPRIHIVRRDRNKPMTSSRVESLQDEEFKTFQFSETQFMAVTAYQNQLITKLKIEKNPFAKGFRDPNGRSIDYEMDKKSDILPPPSMFCPTGFLQQNFLSQYWMEKLQQTKLAAVPNNYVSQLLLSKLPVFQNPISYGGDIRIAANAAAPRFSLADTNESTPEVADLSEPSSPGDETKIGDNRRLRGFFLPVRPHYRLKLNNNQMYAGLGGGTNDGLSGGLGLAGGLGSRRPLEQPQLSAGGSGFSRPQAMFKTLRRLHGHNLESQGLNNISDAFQAFVTRARFFSVGRLRRTWSHSAVEFMKYRKLLPMLVADENEIGSAFDDFDAGLSMESSRLSMRSKSDNRKVVVTNVSPRATVSQLQSFFNKFGKVTSCHMPTDDRRQSLYATLPKNPRCKGTVYVTFKKEDGVDRCLNAPKEELKFYDQYMTVALHVSKSRKGTSSSRTPSQSGAESLGIGFAIPAGPPTRQGTISRGSSNVSLSSSTATLSIHDSPGSFTLEDLPPRALQRVLSFASPIDRIRLERVNKAWLEAAIMSWSECPRLSFRDDRHLLHLFTKQNPLRNTHLKQILYKCGFHLRELDLSKVTHLLDDKAFDIIASSCPNLELLNISGVNGSLNALRYLGEALPKLRTVVYRDMGTLGEKSFWYLFRNCGSTVKSIDLSGCRRLLGRCFKLFSNNLESVTLDGCSRIDDETIEDICLRSSNVRELRLNWCIRVTDGSISLITRNLMDLEVLSLCGDKFTDMTSVALRDLSRLRSLTHLYFDHNTAVDNSVITVLSESASKLKCISLANSGSDTQITATGLLSLRNLSQLEEVDLSSLAGVNNDVLKALVEGCPKLTTIRLRSCIYLGDEGVTVLASLPHLELIDLSGCILVSTAAIQTIISAFRATEQENKAITLVVGGTVCDITQVRLRNSRVVLDEADYSGCSLESARSFINTMQRDLHDEYSDDDLSDGEFDSLNAQRSFIVDALNGEDDSPLEGDKAMLEWAHREAVSLGLIPDEDPPQSA